MKHISLPNDQLIPAIKQLIDEGHTATFRVRGFSMRPFLEDRRDSAVIAPVQPDDVQVGDVVLAEVSPRHYVLHRAVKRVGDDLTLRGDGNVRGTESCKTTDVIGRATCFLRGQKQRPTETTNWRWRTYSRLWPSSPLVRRVLLAFYRRIVVRFFIHVQEIPTSPVR